MRSNHHPTDCRGMSLPGILLLIVCGLTLSSLGTMAFLQYGIRGVLNFSLIIAGLISLGLIGHLLFRLLAARRAARFEKALSERKGGDVIATDPEESARREDFRQKFMAGLKTLTDSGKDLTALPLYVMVGEPGAGKTEAIRHSSIRFPQGVNDLLQGVGGTYNMDWWFTNEAIILDTAGALLLEESNKAKFEEFLALLKQYRPDYPISGLVLAIPADSLLVDGENGLGHKAGRLVEQFAILQESLDVRYPVYVMVTKCDLVTGFREFFDAPGNSAFQSQMLGWSNPEGLDLPFDPSRTDRLLEPLFERLQRISNRLLNADWPAGTESGRLGRLDAIHAFPGEFRRLFKPLGQYLEILFRSDRWKNKRPPFFRGIYFTSSLRHGAVLDQELAAALNIPLSRLPEVKGYQTEKSLFLRDFFLEKLFRENGLVTRLTNVAGGIRSRLMRFYLTTASVMLLLVLIAAYASHQLGRRLAAENKLWEVANQTWDNGTFLPMFERNGSSGEWLYTGGEKVGNSGLTRTEYLAKISAEVGKGLGWGKYFAPLPAYRQLKHDRERARIVIVEGSIVRPLLQAARQNLSGSKSLIATDNEVAATLALIELEALVQQGRLPSEDEVARIFGPLYRLAAPATFAPANGEAPTKLISDLSRLICNAWSDVDSGDLDRMRWMTEAPPYPAISRGITMFTEHKRRIDDRQAKTKQGVLEREKLALEFMKYEDELWTLVENQDNYEKITNWLGSLQEAGKRLDEIADPATSSMRRLKYAEQDARLRSLIPKLPSPLAGSIARMLETVGPSDSVWVGAEEEKRAFDPQSDTALLWAAYLDCEDGMPLYRKRLDALISHFPLIDPDHELTKQFKVHEPGQLQTTLDSLGKRVEDRSKLVAAYPEAPKLLKEDPADPTKVRADASRTLQKRLDQIAERGKAITVYLDRGTKELLHAKYLAGPFNDALKAHQALIFRKPFGSGEPALSPAHDFRRAAEVITFLAGDFAACDVLNGNSLHYELKRVLEPLCRRVGDRTANKRTRFEVICQAKKAVADDGLGVVMVPVEIGPFFIPELVAQKRGFKFMPPFVKEEKVVVAKGIRKVKVGKPRAEIEAKPEGKNVPVGQLSLADPIRVSVEWEEAEGLGDWSQGHGGDWGTLDFILASSGNGAASVRQVDVLDALGKKLTLSFKFPNPYPADPRPKGFE